MRIIFAVVLVGFLVAGAFTPNQAARRLAETSAPAPAPASKPEQEGGVSSGGFPSLGFGSFEIPTSTVCYEEGCYNRAIACPAECFKSWEKGNSAGGSGACVLDCKKCSATC